ncbi:c-type heme family protein [Calothrix sp. 336/3]|uniref:c-type heme family protein n=1 Tax=Calothrix sp. 336/3 TaxID=1337936 RepID=UPI0004E3B8ED|nr:DUF3365 domain-containing protein [Calothrix sp. 336/3]AKG23205.1 histidine kinase [Calothrix sp. 336/3]
MFNNFNLKQKFNIILALILAFGLTASGTALSLVLQQNAKQEIATTALALMEHITALREYTVLQITPELASQSNTKFLPQTVSAYAARQVFEIFRQQSEFKDFFYKEAALNPTNLRDKADTFEAQIIEKFYQNRNLKQVTGYRTFAGGDMFYVARPLSVSHQSCLQCHSTPEAAPKTMVEIYGNKNGFQWKLNDIVAAQIISLPATAVMNKANQFAFIIIVIVFFVFILVTALINILLNWQIIRPIKQMTNVAEAVSVGHLEAEFHQTSNDEIGNLARAFKRMKLSLEMAMRRLRNQSDNETENYRE